MTRGGADAASSVRMVAMRGGADVVFVVALGALVLIGLRLGAERLAAGAARQWRVFDERGMPRAELPPRLDHGAPGSKGAPAFCALAARASFAMSLPEGVVCD